MNRIKSIEIPNVPFQTSILAFTTFASFLCLTLAISTLLSQTSASGSLHSKYVFAQDLSENGELAVLENSRTAYQGHFEAAKYAASSSAHQSKHTRRNLPNFPRADIEFLTPEPIQPSSQQLVPTSVTAEQSGLCPPSIAISKTGKTEVARHVPISCAVMAPPQLKKREKANGVSQHKL